MAYECVIWGLGCVQIKMGCGRARGVRRNTRDMFSKGFGNHGLPSMKTYLTMYKVTATSEHLSLGFLVLHDHIWIGL